MQKPAIILIMSFCLSSVNGWTQESGSHLCAGHYWSEDEGAQFLNNIRSQVAQLKDWEQRAGRIREGIIKGADIPDLDVFREIPSSRESDALIMNGYTVQSLAVRTSDSTWVYGNLYKPVLAEGELAVILCPHGHWSNPSDYGRYRDDMQMRCATLARMGAMVFAYDMLGYGETDTHEHHHPQALKMQCWNSIRILDYLLSRPEVDQKRVGITGASGGGTQSFLLTALDNRIRVAVPAVQVSAHFFGGCICESGLPIHAWKGFQTSNVEIAALAAPRPMLLISDGDDWTKNTPMVEFPHIQWVYSLFGAEEKVENAHFEDEVHDYGPNKRQPMYRFMIKHLGLSGSEIMLDTGLIDESFVKILSREKLEFDN